MPSIARISRFLIPAVSLLVATFMFMQLTPAHAQTPEDPTPTPVPQADDPTNTPVPETPTPVPPTSTPAPEPQPTPATPVPTAVPATPTPTMPPPANFNSAFRIPPTVSLRPVNDVLSWNQDGLVEILFRNPTLNDRAMEVELSVSIPAGFHLYGEGLATDVAAGTASAHYVVHPGLSRTIYLSVKADKIGRSTLHFSGHYWPAGSKDLFNPISLTHPFTVTQASENALNPPKNNPSGNDGQNGSTAAAGCTVGSIASGDMALLSLGLLGMTGMVLVRRRR